MFRDYDAVKSAWEQMIQAKKGTGAVKVGQRSEAEDGGYLDALAADENEQITPITPADRVYRAKMRRLQQEDAPPERRNEPIAKRDLDELMQLYQDIANPMTTSEDRLEGARNMIHAETPKDQLSIGEQAEDAISYFMRKMVDAGDSVTQIAKAVKDDCLYPYFNMARSSASAGINMIQGEQTDATGKRTGDSLNGIFSPIREKGEAYYTAFQEYILHLHNVDRMNLVNGDSTAKLDAEIALREFDKENPGVGVVQP